MSNTPQPRHRWVNGRSRSPTVANIFKITLESHKIVPFSPIFPIFGIFESLKLAQISFIFVKIAKSPEILLTNPN